MYSWLSIVWMRKAKCHALALLTFAVVGLNAARDTSGMVHLSMTRSGQVLVSWSVNSSSAKSRASIRYAPVDINLEDGILAYASKISRWGDQLLVSAEMANLTEGKLYSYQCSNDAGTLWGPVFQLRVPPGAIALPVSSTASPTGIARIAVLGELDVDNTNGPALVQGISGAPAIDLALHLGISLVDTATLKAERFLEMVEPVASRIPYMTVPGSHDATDIYTSLFPMPAVGGDLWYSFTLGTARVIVLWTQALVIKRGQLDTQNEAVQRQMSWLQKQLELSALGTVERARRPWLIVAGRQPIYCSMSHDVCGEEAAKLREVLEPLLHSYGVDLYLSARLHAYERSHPVYENARCAKDQKAKGWIKSPCAPIYITNGDAGFPSLRYHSVPAHWTARRHPGAAGYGELTFHNATHLQYRQVVASTQEDIRDEFWILKLDATIGPGELQEEDFLEAVFWLGFVLFVVTFTCGFIRWIHGDGLKRRDEALRNLRTELAVLSGDAPRVIGTSQENESLVNSSSQCVANGSENLGDGTPHSSEVEIGH